MSGNDVGHNDAAQDDSEPDTDAHIKETDSFVDTDTDLDIKKLLRAFTKLL